MRGKVKYVVFALLVLILMVFATIYDLEINKKIYNPDAPLSTVFEVIGEFPIYIGVLLFGVTFYNASHKKMIKNLMLIESFFATFIFLMMPSRYIFKFNLVNMGIILLLSVIIWMGIIKLSTKVDNDVYQKIKWVVFAYGIGIILQLVTIYAMKLTWSRQRFYTLDEGYEGFTPWYVINWFKGDTSFPSGHTSGATNILYLSLLAETLDKNKTRNIVIKVLCYSFIFMTGFSRIVLGRHYLSDVVMGFAITYIIHKVVVKSIKDRQIFVKSI